MKQYFLVYPNISTLNILLRKYNSKPTLAQSIELEKSFNGKLSRVIRSHIPFLYISRTCSTCAFKFKYFLKSFFRNFSSANHFSPERCLKNLRDLFEISHDFLMIG